MRFEVLRQRVQRPERRVESSMDRAQMHRQEFGQAWRRGWTPGRIVIAGLLSGFLVGRAEPLSKVGGTRWLQLLGTVSSMLASLQAAAASQEAAETADVAAEEAAAANENLAEATGQSAAGARASTANVPPGDPLRTQAPSPAEAATELSER